MSTTTAQGRIGHCRIRTPGTLLECLAAFGLGREEAQWLVSFGAVYHEMKRATSDRTLSPGQYVRVHLQPKRFPVQQVDWQASVKYGDDEFIVANKPAGIPVHATVDNQSENVVHQLSVVMDVPLRITQRLDSDVGGLLILAKTSQFQRQFNQLLVERKVKKRYRALVNRAPRPGRYIHYMMPGPRSPRIVQCESRSDWLQCVLSIDRVTRLEGPAEVPRFEIEIDLETGRTHQIRAQLSAVGSPIIGDKLYGSPTSYEVYGRLLPGIALFSASTSWSLDDGPPRLFTLEPPWVGFAKREESGADCYG